MTYSVLMGTLNLTYVAMHPGSAWFVVVEYKRSNEYTSTLLCLRPHRAEALSDAFV